MPKVYGSITQDQLEKLIEPVYGSKKYENSRLKLKIQAAKSKYKSNTCSYFDYKKEENAQEP